MPTLKQLRYLVAVAETLHFRRAAEMSHVSQPTLSGQLRELEERLGVQLVERSRSKVILTPLGRQIAERAKTVLRDVQDVVELAKQGQAPLGGTIRVGVLQSLGPYFLPHILPELHGRYRDLKLYVREGMPTALLERLDQGNLDMLFFPLPVQGAELRSVRLFREPLWVVVPGEHRLASRETIRRSDLEGETFLTLERGHRLHDQVRALCEQYGAKLSLDYEGTSLDTLRQMVAMGMGLSLLPALYVRSEVLHDRQVVAREVKSGVPHRMIGMVWRRHSGRQEEYETLAGQIRGILKDRKLPITVVS
ncbi:MAG: LysR substrate-binding domain-containing protein [Kiloniellales bacterium]|nr:LysR substrate-binding domain-containing protein [Kiloniellales bacterium]MDJ0971978.1 LysR substrate-binding domain-containing protein [Kiloniellales bacterium]MDJ0980301.1 LysR substrate-binding domain-containing protein [Kiloniellales bacterium]